MVKIWVNEELIKPKEVVQVIQKACAEVLELINNRRAAAAPSVPTAAIRKMEGWEDLGRN